MELYYTLDFELNISKTYLFKKKSLMRWKPNIRLSSKELDTVAIEYQMSW